MEAGNPAGVYFENNGTNNNHVQTIHCEGMRGGRVYDADGRIAPQEMQTCIDHDPLLQWFQKKVTTVALKEALLRNVLGGVSLLSVVARPRIPLS